MIVDIQAVLARGSQSAAGLRQGLGISQPTLSRTLRRLRGDVAMFGRGRATRYALYRRVRDLAPDLPVSRISGEGVAERIGTLVTIAPDRFWYEDHEVPAASAEHLALPWFLTDMRPQGYLGRLFPQIYADLGLPDRIADWSEDQALYAIARRGEDAVGNLMVGEESLARWVGWRSADFIVPEGARLERYALLADQALEGRTAGSSAAGEQPKFTACVSGGAQAGGAHEARPGCHEPRTGLRQAIVKFSGPLTTAAGRRWSDLLAAEHLAGIVLREHGHSSTRANYLNDGRRAYLEVERFDRCGERGRMGLVSLGALDDEFVGERRGWPESAAALLRSQLISADDARELRFLSAFGALIANTDMHLGNASFLIDGYMRFKLAPAYDMLPMMFAPLRDEVPRREFTRPAPRPGCADQWTAALAAAREFWQRCAESALISEEFRQIAARSLATLTY